MFTIVIFLLVCIHLVSPVFARWLAGALLLTYLLFPLARPKAREAILWLSRQVFQHTTAGKLRMARIGQQILRIIPGDLARLNATGTDIHIASWQGDATLAAVQAEALLKKLPSNGTSWRIINLLVDSFVTAGKYNAALNAQACWPQNLLDILKAQEPLDYTLTIINQAEALYNLGAWEKALEQLRQIDQETEAHPLARHGAYWIQAWVYTHALRLDEAAASISQIVPDVFPRAYRAEVAYVEAVYERECGNYPLALEHAANGCALAMRPSSVRNGMNIRASILFRMGAYSEAMDLFELAIAHSYKAQAAYGLLYYIALMEQRNDLHAIPRLRSLIAERDPESKLELLPLFRCLATHST